MHSTSDTGHMQEEPLPELAAAQAQQAQAVLAEGQKFLQQAVQLSVQPLQPPSHPPHEEKSSQDNPPTKKSRGSSSEREDQHERWIGDEDDMDDSEDEEGKEHIQSYYEDLAAGERPLQRNSGHGSKRGDDYRGAQQGYLHECRQAYQNYKTKTKQVEIMASEACVQPRQAIGAQAGSHP